MPSVRRVRAADRRPPRRPPASSTGSAASPTTCGSRSPRSAPFAAPIACRRRGCRRSRGDDLLTAAEIARLVGIGARDLGIREVRFTGGEPLTRGDLVDIVRAVCRGRARHPAVDDDERHRPGRTAPAPCARPASAASTSRSTPIDREHFARLTRRDRLPRVLDGLGRRGRRRSRPDQGQRRAHARDPRRRPRPARVRARARPAAALHRADAARRRRRTGAATTWCPPPNCSTCSAPASTLTAIGRADDPSSPAEEWQVDAGPATVGIIASVTRSFCAACDRTRITAEGTVRSCLFGDDETDLRGAAARRAPRTTRSPTAGAPPCGTSRPATASTPPTSRRPRAAWGRSVAEVRFFAAAAEAAGRDAMETSLRHRRRAARRPRGALRRADGAGAEAPARSWSTGSSPATPRARSARASTCCRRSPGG